MLSVFPELLLFSIVGPTILRIAVGGFFLALALRHWRGRAAIGSDRFPLVGAPGAWLVTLLSVVELVLGILFIVGIFTQALAILGLLGVAMPAFFGKTGGPFSPYSRMTYCLVGAMCITLLLMGAGAFAFDLPL